MASCTSWSSLKMQNDVAVGSERALAIILLTRSSMPTRTSSLVVPSSARHFSMKATHDRRLSKKLRGGSIF